MAPPVTRRATHVDASLLRWAQRNERTLIVLWLAGAAGLLAVLGIWGVALNGAERLVERWDSAWIAQLDVAAEDLGRGAPQRAATRLERIVRDNGVSSVKHRFDKQHERALGLLADAHLALGRKSKALATLERLVQFDPRNFDNHFRQAQALEAFREPAAAQAAYERVLAIHPTHWPSVAAWIQIDFAAGRYERIPDFYERYLDAWLLARVRIVAGERETWVELQADGRAHEAQAELELPPGWSGAVRVETGGYSVDLESLELAAPVRAGVAGRFAPLTLPGGELTAHDASSSLELGHAQAHSGVQRLLLRATLFKRLTPQTWAQVEKSYENALLHERLTAARARSRVGGCDEAGTVFTD